MGYKKTSYLLQLWHMIKYAVTSWIEWQDAKDWAELFRPGWLLLATKAKSNDVRQMYRVKILAAYRGIYNE